MSTETTNRNRLPIWPVLIYACAVFAGQLSIVAAGFLAEVDVVPAVLIAAGIVASALAGLWVDMKVTSREKALLALVKKCAIDQNRAYFEDIVPADILAAAGLSAQAKEEGR